MSHGEEEEEEEERDSICTMQGVDPVKEVELKVSIKRRSRRSFKQEVGPDWLEEAGALCVRSQKAGNML